MSNQFCFVGSIGRDAELKSLPSGSDVLSDSVACNTGYGDNKKTIVDRDVEKEKIMLSKITKFLKELDELESKIRSIK